MFGREECRLTLTRPETSWKQVREPARTPLSNDRVGTAFAPLRGARRTTCTQKSSSFASGRSSIGDPKTATARQQRYRHPLSTAMRSLLSCRRTTLRVPVPALQFHPTPSGDFRPDRIRLKFLPRTTACARKTPPSPVRSNTRHACDHARMRPLHPLHVGRSGRSVESIGLARPDR